MIVFMEQSLLWYCKKFNELSPDELYALLKLRSQVFVVEQQAIYLDLDDRDQHGFHLMLKNSTGLLIACSRLLPPGILYPEAVIGRVVIDPAWRGRGLAHELMQQAVSRCFELFNTRQIHISAQKHLQNFYARHGFKSITDDYLEDGIPHVGMLLDTADPDAKQLTGPVNCHVRYLGHSAWLVITPARCLLFDYGDRPTRQQSGNLADGIFNLDELPAVPLYVFVSHRHSDHYSAQLHSKVAKRPQTSFVLGLDEQPSSSDSETAPAGTWLAWPRAEIQIDDLMIHCSGSTDSGVSFLIEMPEGTLYHGGDLALWDNTAFYNRVFREETDWLADRCIVTGKQPDIAFLPVSTSDGYQEEPLLAGLWYFLEKIEPRHILPMHGHGYEDLYQSFAELATAKGFNQVTVLQKRGEATNFVL
jgi:ElaA protein